MSFVMSTAISIYTFLFRTYGIKQFGSVVIPTNDNKEPLKFEFKVFNIKGRSMHENKVFNFYF